jgi:tetratricopeptide (TPR) repeat protein
VMPSAHRLVFGEVLRTMGDVKAAIIYYEQAASTKNAAPVIRYLASLAYLNMDLLDRSAYVAQLLSRDRGGKLLSRILESLRTEQTGNADAAAHSLSDAASMRGFPKWEYDEAYFQLGGMYERRNNIDAAVSAYEKVSPSAPYADIVERVRALF